MHAHILLFLPDAFLLLHASLPKIAFLPDSSCIQQPSKDNILEMDKTQEEDYIRPSISRYQRSLIHYEGNNKRDDCDQPRHEFKMTTS
jgi:hypothetical protein